MGTKDQECQECREGHVLSRHCLLRDALCASSSRLLCKLVNDRSASRVLLVCRFMNRVHIHAFASILLSRWRCGVYTSLRLQDTGRGYHRTRCVGECTSMTRIVSSTSPQNI